MLFLNHRSLASVSYAAVDFFRPSAQRLIEEKGAVDALAAAPRYSASVYRPSWIESFFLPEFVPVPEEGLRPAILGTQALLLDQSLTSGYRDRVRPGHAPRDAAVSGGAVTTWDRGSS